MNNAFPIRSVVFARQIEPSFLNALALHGVHCVCVDFLSIKLETSIAVNQILQHENKPMVFTSAHAVNAIQNMQINNAIKAYVITGNTKEKAILAGFEIRGEANNSVGLANVIVSKLEKAVLHLTTVDRRQELGGILKGNGIDYSVLEVYNKVNNPQIVSGFDAIVFYSPSQVDAFLKFNVFKQQMTAFCLGHTTGNYLKEKGLVQVVVAKEQTTESIIASIVAFNTKII